MQNMMIDITEMKRKEEIIINSLKEKEVMVKEIHHRVKNNLQIMLSLIRMQRQNCDETDVKNFYKSCENRINTMAMIHEKLYSASDLNNIKFPAYVENLLTHLLQVYGFSESHIKINCDFDDIKIPIDKAMSCGMIINELVSNSLKYAFSQTNEGNINIKMKESGGLLELTYNDSGTGNNDLRAEGKKNTMGIEIIEMLSTQLSGKAELNLNGGMNFSLKFSAN
jgi:two-component sensor histidine kinase